jgi:hypothetical protein
MRKLLPALVFTLLTVSLWGQSFYFGPRLGGSMGFQRWENFQQSPLLTYHGDFFIESFSEENPLNALYAYLGWHNRGSAYRNQRYFTIDGDILNVPTKNFIFSNAVLGVGGKRFQQLNKKMQTYYLIGLRAEYTVLTNLSEYDQFNAYFNYPFYPDNDFVKKLNYGVSVGGGMEYRLGKMAEGIIEFSVNPDLSRQYEQPPIPNVPDPYQPGKLTSIKNITLELTFGLKFLRKVVYLDY